MKNPNEMTVTAAKYVKAVGPDGPSSSNSHLICTIDDVKCGVPLDTGNKHYQAVLKWVEAGNTIEAAS